MRILSGDMSHAAQAGVDCVVEEGDWGVTSVVRGLRPGQRRGRREERENTGEREREAREETWRPEHVNTTFRSTGPGLNLFLVNGWDCKSMKMCLYSLQLAKVQILTIERCERCCVSQCKASSVDCVGVAELE